jgi:hypothetical protein
MITTAFICVPYGFVARSFQFAGVTRWLNLGQFTFIVPLSLLHVYSPGAVAKLYENNPNYTVQRRAATADFALLLSGYCVTLAFSARPTAPLARLPILLATFVATGSAANRQMQMRQDH